MADRAQHLAQVRHGHTCARVVVMAPLGKPSRLETGSERGKTLRDWGGGLGTTSGVYSKVKFNKWINRSLFVLFLEGVSKNQITPSSPHQSQTHSDSFSLTYNTATHTLKQRGLHRVRRRPGKAEKKL